MRQAHSKYLQTKIMNRFLLVGPFVGRLQTITRRSWRGGLSGAQFPANLIFRGTDSHVSSGITAFWPLNQRAHSSRAEMGNSIQRHPQKRSFVHNIS